jgi:hypothetical protein
MALVFAFTMVFPFAAFASDVEVLTVPIVNDDDSVSLGTLFFDFTAGQLQPGDIATISLPEDFEFLVAGKKHGETDSIMKDANWAKDTSGTVAGLVYGEPGGNYFKIPDKYLDNDNAFGTTGGLQVRQIDDNEIKVEVTGTLDDSQNAYLYLYLGNVYVEDGFDGDIELRISAPSDSGFAAGNIAVGRVSGGAVDIEVTDAPTFSDSDQVTIRFEEEVPDSLDDVTESLKLTLPDGFVWKSVDSATVFWGEAENTKTSTSYTKTDLETNLGAAGTGKWWTISDDELDLDLPDGFESKKALAFEIKATIDVDDETDAQVGDIVAKVDGESDYNQNELVVGKYGQYEVSITADEPKDLVAGMLEQEIADIIIEESIKESLIPGRTLTLTLPSNFKWGEIDTDTDSGTGLKFVGFPGKDGKTAKWEVTDYSTDAAKLKLSEMEVAIEPGTTGDLVVEVGGTAGLSGELVVGKVYEPVTITASDKPVLAIGKAGQPIGDLTITENIAGALSEDDDLELHLPDGFKWSKYSDIEVTEGDLEIDEGGITTANDDRILVIPIEDDSTEASTIKLTNLEVTVDRSAPEGDMYVKVKGDAVNEVNNESEVKDVYGTIDGGYLKVNGELCFDVDSDYKLFPETGTAAKTYAATVGTPAPADQTLSTSITLGDNGSYISDGRIMVQLRDAAKALGVAEQNIFWDNATKTATFIKGDRVAQITVGDPQVKLNGVALPTDKGAELKDGRTFVSLSAAGVALGASASWDNTTKTATLTIK